MSQINCLLCQESIEVELTWQELFSFQPIQKTPICQNCLKRWHPYQVEESACSACGRLLGEGQEDIYHQSFSVNDRVYCLDCYRWLGKYPVELLHHRGMYHYEGGLKDSLYRYKYQGDIRMAQLFAKDLKKVYRFYRKFDWLVLPSSPASLNQRGFHATGQLLKAAGIPFRCPFIYKGDGIKQASKNRQARLKLTNPFEWDSKQPLCLKSKQAHLLFDDVYTTGATMLCAKDCLSRRYLQVYSNLEKIRSISLARD